MYADRPGAIRLRIDAPPRVRPTWPIGVAVSLLAAAAAGRFELPVLLSVPLVLACATTLRWLAGGILYHEPSIGRSLALAASLVAVEAGAVGVAFAATIVAPLLLAMPVVAVLSVMNLYGATLSEALAILYLSFVPAGATHAALAAIYLVCR